ncbi:MAG: hypothetical protein DBY35_02025 [Bacteroidales bacterium]|nr:MAG: hypothetical protein DBY35_02025 [Bacteroidales bacterium]
MDGKKVLFVGLGFYNYDSAIKATLDEMGYDTVYATSLVDLGVTGKLFKKLCLGAINRRRADNRVWQNILASRTDNDIIFVIKGENLTRRHLEYLKQKNPKARFVLYLWDNLDKIHNRDILLPYFDKISSFDPSDCLCHKDFFFRPLFYQKKGSGSASYKYDISFIGEDRPGRYRFLKKVASLLPSDKNVYFRLKSSVLRTVIDKITGHRLCNNLKLPYDEFCQVTDSSKAVLDIVEENQSGLTMRTIEALAMGKHLYTTNREIQNAPHISPSSFTVLDVDKPVLELGKEGGQDAGFYEYYSLRHCLSDILE